VTYYSAAKHFVQAITEISTAEECRSLYGVGPVIEAHFRKFKKLPDMVDNDN